VLDKEIQSLFAAIPETGSIGELRKILSGMYAKHLEAVHFLVEKKDVTDQPLHELRARNLVENETFVFVGLLMLRSALRDQAREPLAEQYIRDARFDFERNWNIVMNGGTSVIEKHRQVIDY